VCARSRCSRVANAVLRPGCIALSPACGIFALAAPTFASNAYTLALPPGHLQGKNAAHRHTYVHGSHPSVIHHAWIHPSTHALSLRTRAGLCRELFHKPSDSLRVANSRSRAASHLSPDMLGHIVGLGIADAREAVVKDCLGRLGIETNRIHGEWTGYVCVCVCVKERERERERA
jgi:hypothetical protein